MEVRVVIAPSGSDESGFSAEAEVAIREASPRGAVERVQEVERGVLAEISTIVLGVMIVGEFSVWLAGCWARLRRACNPLTIVDCSGDEVRVDVRDVPGMRGVLIVRTKSGEDIRIEDPGDESRLVGLIERAMGRS